jgi:hypothetical protein
MAKIALGSEREATIGRIPNGIAVHLQLLDLFTSAGTEQAGKS